MWPVHKLTQVKRLVVGKAEIKFPGRAPGNLINWLAFQDYKSSAGMDRINSL